MNLKVLSLAFLFGMPGLLARAQQEEVENLIVTEVCVANIDQTLDDSNNYGSWIELYNPTGMPVRLNGLYISDDSRQLCKHRLTGYGTLDAHSYQCVFFDHNAADGVFGGNAEKQVRFKLNADGGDLFLSDEEGNIVCQVSYPVAVSRCSYARVSLEGSEWKYCGNPTPSSPNAGPFATEQLTAPVTDCDSRLFDVYFDVHVKIPQGTTLCYTTDGSTPTLANSRVSADGIFHISCTTTLRFRLFGEGFLPSRVVTRTYIYKDKAYYLPIVAVTTDPRNLYDDYLGCYVNGKNGVTGRGSTTPSNINMDWERPVNFEYLTAEGQMVINQEVSFEVAGGYSRHFPPASFKLHAKKLYDSENSFDYPLFVHKPYCKYKQLLVRNGGNNNRTDGGPRIKDAITQQVVASSGFYLNTQEYQPVHVFINGKYLAMMNVREPTNRYHGCANYGYDNDEMDSFEYSGGYRQISGTRDAFDRLVALSASAEDSDTYAEIRALLDVDEFANYMAAICYTGSYDWVLNNNNVKGYRSQDEGKFHFVFFDQDLTWERTNNVANIDRVTSNEVLTLYNNLKRNHDFRRHFVTAYCLLHGSVYAPNRCEYIADSICALVKDALSMDRRYTTSTYNKMRNDMWGNANREARIKSLEETFRLTSRINVTVASNIAEGHIYINGQTVPTKQFCGTLFDSPTLSTASAEGYRFLGWQDETGSWVSHDNICAVSKDGTYTAVYDKAFDNQVSPICINEVCAANSVHVNDYIKHADWIELYNRSDTPIDLADCFFSDEPDNPTKCQLDAVPQANTVIPPHGYMVVWCDDQPSKTQPHLPFKLKNQDGGFVGIQSGDGSWNDALCYNHHREQTVGRIPNGSNKLYLLYHPTIAMANLQTSYDTAICSAPSATACPPSGATEIVGVRYYNLDGTQTSCIRRNGVYIKKIEYRDGTSISRKVVKS